MCDDQTERELELHLKNQGLTRRDLSKLGAGVALGLLLPPVAGASGVNQADVTVPTPDGRADCVFVHPGDGGASPAVILWPDIRGLRPAFRTMASRLAGSGYAVLLVNPFYRQARAPVVQPGESFSDPQVRERLRPMARALTPDKVLADGAAFIEWLKGRPEVDADRPMAVMGYCMSGSFALRLAAAEPETIAAAASFHGGRLATDADDSPHRLADQIRAGVLIAIAENDHQRDPQARDRLVAAFNAAGVDAEIEVYEGAMHGWCPPDSGAYNEAQAERAWSRLLALLARQLA